MDANRYPRGGDIGNKFMRAGDYSPGDLNRELTVEEVGEVTFDRVTKLTLKFRGVGPRLVLNKTNSKTMSGAFGNDTSRWVGQQVTLMSVEVEYDGNMVPSLLLDVVTEAV